MHSLCDTSLTTSSKWVNQDNLWLKNKSKSFKLRLLSKPAKLVKRQHKNDIHDRFIFQWMFQDLKFSPLTYVTVSLFISLNTCISRITHSHNLSGTSLLVSFNYSHFYPFTRTFFVIIIFGAENLETVHEWSFTIYICHVQSFCILLIIL